jgi:hypothetical protein
MRGSQILMHPAIIQRACGTCWLGSSSQTWCSCWSTVCPGSSKSPSSRLPGLSSLIYISSKNPRCQFFNEVVHTTIYEDRSPPQDWSLPGLIYTVHRPPNIPIKVSKEATAVGCTHYLTTSSLCHHPFSWFLGLFTLEHLVLQVWEILCFHTASESRAQPLYSSSRAPGVTPNPLGIKILHISSLLCFNLRARPPSHWSSTQCPPLNECHPLGKNKQVGDGQKAETNVPVLNAT